VIVYLRSALANLRTEVVRRADDCVGLIKRVRQYTRDAEVSDLQDTVQRQKYVGSLQVCTHRQPLVPRHYRSVGLQEPYKNILQTLKTRVLNFRVQIIRDCPLPSHNSATLFCEILTRCTERIRDLLRMRYIN